MARYRNSFHNPHDPAYGPEFYETDAVPVEHCGMLIYRRLNCCFDIVNEGGVCVGQYAGLNGAKDAVEKRFGRATPLRDLAS